MRTQRGRIIAGLTVGLLGLYAIAALHQVIPHSAHHGDGSHCALCVLFAGAVLATGPVTLSCILWRRRRPVLAAQTPLARLLPSAVFVRGPPSAGL